MSTRSVILACGLSGVAALVGGLFMDQPYRLEGVGHPGDQVALDHRDSAYSSITWACSPADNYLQLRFFDRVEGGVCLKPSWADLAELGRRQPSLAHLVPATAPAAKPASAMWPHTWTPDPGTLSNSAYVRMFPAGVLLNERLMAAAKGDTAAAAPRVLVVGLGSGIGLATLAHHFPQVAITVVDIDQVVIDMVRDHYPLLDWLAGQKRADGEARLRFMARDARQYIRFDARRETPYDLVILDAYTSGSTIPPHLMTREFFAECGSVLGDGGLVLANIIGNVAVGADGRGDKSMVLGGAIRSFRAAGLEQVWCFPILNHGDSTGLVDANRQRNNIVIAGKDRPLDPRGAAAGWERLSRFVPVPELSVGTYVTSSYFLYRLKDNRFRHCVSASLDAAFVDRADPSLRAQMTAGRHSADAVQVPIVSESNDRKLVERVVHAVKTLAAKESRATGEGWHELGDASIIMRQEMDWVLAARETVRTSVATARDATKWSGVALTGDVEQGERAAVQEPTWLIPDAPLFTDQRPNADIYNR